MFFVHKYRVFSLTELVQRHLEMGIVSLLKNNTLHMEAGHDWFETQHFQGKVNVGIYLLFQWKCKKFFSTNYK